MSFWLTCAGMVAVTFGSRFSGLLLQHDLPPFWLRLPISSAHRSC